MKIWLITGCSSGLGRGIAEAALKRGENVAATARNVEKIEELAKKYPSQTLLLGLDLNDRESMRSAVECTKKVFGGIDVLVNNHDQPGDPMKGGEVIVLLGSDAAQTEQTVLKDRLLEAEKWMDISRRSDY